MVDELNGIDLLFARYCTENSEARQIMARLLATIRAGKLALELTDGESEIIKEKVHFEGVVVSGKKLYLKRHYLLEQCFYRELERICHAPLGKKIKDCGESKLQGKQLEALLACQEQKFWMITGGPGTGKSFTIAELIRLFSPSISIVATAPTGKATVRLRELLPAGKYEVMTLHRLLKVGKGERIESLTYDLIIVDESSMVDVALFTRLVSAIKSGSRLILVGDHEQLPPVEGASYFKELIEKKREYTTFLQGSQRVERNELIELAEKARMGESLSTEPLLWPEKMIEQCEDALLFKPDDGFEKLTQIKMLTPLRGGIYGVELLNQRFFERQKERFPTAAVPIIVTINDPRFEVYNGDMGLLRGDEVSFPDGRIISRFCLRKFELAYVLSVHKSQGSEYDEIILLLPEGAARFGKELLYTAITRAKKRVRIFA